LQEENAMVRSSFFFIALLAAAPALAQEPAGCTSFKWPLDHERALLASPAQVASGGAVSQPQTAVSVALVPFTEAKLPQAPSRAPKYPDSYAGFVQASAPASAGTYRITLSHGAWIDVIQDGRTLKSVAFTGAKGCDGIAKSVKFDLAAAPFVIELSGTAAHSVGLVVTPD
jgi:hypothetical protein